MVGWKNVRIIEGTLLDIKSTISFAISSVVNSPKEQTQLNFIYRVFHTGSPEFLHQSCDMVPAPRKTKQRVMPDVSNPHEKNH